VKWRTQVTVYTQGLTGIALDVEAEGPLDDPIPAPVPPSLTALRVTDELEEGWPAARALGSGSFSVAMAKASDAAALQSGQFAVIQVWLPGEAPSNAYTWSMVIGDPEVTPRDYGVDVTVPMADLWSLFTETVGLSDRPQEDARTRINAWWTESGREGTLIAFESGQTWPTLAARPASAMTLQDAIRGTLAYCVRTGTMGKYLFEAVPNALGVAIVDYAGLETVVVTEGLSYSRQTPILAAPTLGVLTLVGGVWTFAPMTPDPDDRAEVIGALEVVREGSWGRAMGTAVNTIDVVKANKALVTYVLDDGREARIRKRYETDLVDTSAATDLAVIHLTDDWDSAEAWEVESYRVAINATPDGWLPGDLRDVRALVGIVAKWHPDGRTWWAGVIRARTFTYGGRDLYVDLSLASRPLDSSHSLRGSTDVGSVGWYAGFPTDRFHGLPAGMTWDNTDPGLTWAHLAYASE
jgi:hypothetical protein